jgi:hypothetical protein
MHVADSLAFSSNLAKIALATRLHRVKDSRHNREIGMFFTVSGYMFSMKKCRPQIARQGRKMTSIICDVNFL